MIELTSLDLKKLNPRLNLFIDPHIDELLAQSKELLFTLVHHLSSFCSCGNDQKVAEKEKDDDGEIFADKIINVLSQHLETHPTTTTSTLFTAMDHHEIALSNLICSKRNSLCCARNPQ